MKNFKNAFRALKMLLKKYPLYLLLEILSSISLVISTVIPINMTGKIVNVFTSTSGEITNLNSFMDAIGYYIIIQVGILLGLYLFNLVIEFLETYININFSIHVSTTLFKKLDYIDYDFHESTKFLDNYTRALEHGDHFIWSVAKNQIALVKTIVQSVSVFLIVFEIHYLAVVYALVIGIVYYFIRRKVGKIEFENRSAVMPLKRKRNYLGRVMYVKDSMADIKTTEIAVTLLSGHKKIGEEIIDTSKKFLKKKTIYQTIGNILIASIYPVVLGIVAYFILNQKDLGALASITIAATTLSNLVSTFASQITTIQNDVLECQVSFDLLDMKSNIEGIVKNDISDDFKELRVEDVSFSYIDEKNVLDSISLNIKKGEKIAIVGENGAGKTTLVKLLLRLYDTKKGKITYNGMDYKDITPSSLREKVGAVFQNSEVYSVSVAENVLLRKCRGIEDEEKVIEALKFSGLYDYVATLDEGIHTMVTREFHHKGTIFSGGQIQKLAVARGYAQDYEVFILDEPSSALDPIAETKMYHNMLELGKSKTLIFISHRLSATINADRIYLFENGKVKECGTHSELMKIENGSYKEMFESQSEKYLRGDNNV